MMDLSNYKLVSDFISRINENTFLISDTHFFHSNVCEFEPFRVDILTRHFNIGYHIYKYYSDEYKMELHNRMIVEKWNSVVGLDDTVICLGDFAWKNLANIDKLNGYKMLILGNHDRKNDEFYKDHFQVVLRGEYLKDSHGDVYMKPSDDFLYSSLVLLLNGKKILLNHYPPTKEEYRWVKVDAEGNNTKPLMNNRIDRAIKLVKKYDIEYIIHGHTHSNNYVNFYNVSAENLGMQPIQLKDILYSERYPSTHFMYGSSYDITDCMLLDLTRSNNWKTDKVEGHLDENKCHMIYDHIEVSTFVGEYKVGIMYSKIKNPKQWPYMLKYKSEKDDDTMIHMYKTFTDLYQSVSNLMDNIKIECEVETSQYKLTAVLNNKEVNASSKK